MRSDATGSQMLGKKKDFLGFGCGELLQGLTSDEAIKMRDSKNIEKCP